MKKTLIFFLIIVLSLITNSYCSNELVEQYNPTKEELAGEISIPSRNGNWNNYSDINTYEDLYSVLEDLSSDYIELREDYRYLENDIEEKANEISQLKEHVKILEWNLKSTSSNDWALIFIPITLFVIFLILNYLYNKFKKQKDTQ